MTGSQVTWDDGPERFLAADPAATLAVGRATWEAAGAKFLEADDGDGEMPGLAIATIETPVGPTAVGVLNYEPDLAYLLVPGSGHTREAMTRAVLAVLESEGILNIDRDVLGLVDASSDPEALEARVAVLESELYWHVDDLRRRLQEMTPTTTVHEQGQAPVATSQRAEGMHEAFTDPPRQQSEVRDPETATVGLRSGIVEKRDELRGLPPKPRRARHGESGRTITTYSRHAGADDIEHAEGGEAVGVFGGIDIMRAVRSFDPDLPPSATDTARLLKDGDMFARLGDDSEALEFYREAAARGISEGARKAGSLLLSRGDLKGAREAYRQAAHLVTMDP